jgi:hypothetical protein
MWGGVPGRDDLLRPAWRWGQGAQARRQRRSRFGTLSPRRGCRRSAASRGRVRSVQTALNAGWIAARAVHAEVVARRIAGVARAGSDATGATHS